MDAVKSLNKKKLLSRGGLAVWGTLSAIVVLTVVLRIGLLDVPLDRDEGGYAYTARLVLEGVPPFAKAYDIKMPGLYYVYAVILLIFGETTEGIHLGLLIVNAATIVLMFFLGRRLFDTTVGLVACGSYAVMSLSQTVEGFSANAEQLLMLPALGGILLMLRSIESGRLRSLFFSGLVLGTAVVIKHHGIFFAGFTAVYLVFVYFRQAREHWKKCLLRLVVFGVGVVIPFCFLCIMFLWYGLFGKFWFWLFEYTREYSTAIPFSAGLDDFGTQIAAMTRSLFLFLVLAGVGFSALLWDRRARKHGAFLCFFFLFSFLSVCIGFRFFPHYFVLMAGAVSLLAGVGASSVAVVCSFSKRGVVKKMLPAGLVVVAAGYSLFAEREYLFESSGDRILRESYGSNPFPESVVIGRYIKEHTSATDSVGVLGSEPQILFYSGRRSASGHLYMYPLVGRHKYARSMQEEMINEIESAGPEFLVFVNNRSSWRPRTGSEQLIFDWFWEYQEKYYNRVGAIDIIRPELTVYLWGEKCIDYAPQSERWIYVFQRKG